MTCEPDPSPAVVAFVERITVHLSEFLEAKIEIVEKESVAAKVAHRDLVDQQVLGLRELMDERTHFQQRAIELSDISVTSKFSAVNERFESVNEFRATLSDQQRTFATRSEVAQNDMAAAARIAEIAARIDRMEGARVGAENFRNTARQNSNLVIAGAGVVIALIVAVVTVLALRPQTVNQYVPSGEAVVTVTATQ